MFRNCSWMVERPFLVVVTTEEEGEFDEAEGEYDMQP